MINSLNTQKMLAAVWETSPDAWVLSDAAGIVIDANPAYLDFYDLTREQTIGALFYIIFPENFRSEALAQYKETFATAPPQSTFETVFMREGGQRVVETTISFLTENGRRVAMLSCIRDVTKYKNQQVKLSRQSRYQQALVDCSRTLLQADPVKIDQQQLLNEAIEHLRLAAQADRAYLFENFEDPEDGFCSGMRAEARIPEVPQNLLNPDSQKILWSAVPEQNRILLANGRFVGGPVAKTFAGKPAMISWLHEQGIQSVLFLPIHIDDKWWGYIGFDDCQTPREWQMEDITLLQTAAEIVGSTLQRWRIDSALRRQYRYQAALSQFSRILLQNPEDDDQEEKLLTEALSLLRQAAHASRAYIFRNVKLPDTGFCMSMVAESCASGVWPQIQNPANKHMPWEKFPQTMHQQLARGEPLGGPIKQVFAATPEWIKIFENQRNPLLSIQTFPIFFDKDWWGFIGFDEVEHVRQWHDEEISLLGTASEIIASTLQRWQAKKVLEERVQQRTSALVETNAQLQAQIKQRHQAERDLAYRLKIEQKLTSISGYLLQAGDTFEFLQDALHDLGQLVNAQRMFLISLDQKDQLFDSPIVQWQLPALAPFPPDIVVQVKDNFPRLKQQMNQGESVFWHKSAASSEQVSLLKQKSLTEFDINVLVMFPMISEGKLTAVLGCSNFNIDQEVKEANLRILQLGANLIENMLRRETVLASLEKRVADRTKDLTALFDFTMQTSQAKTVADMLEPAIQRIADIAHCQAICVHLLSVEDRTFTLAAQQGLPETQLESLREIDVSPTVKELLKFTEKQALLAEHPNLPSILPDAFNLPEFQTYLGSQLRVRGRPIGFLSVYRVEKDPFELNEISLLVVLAEQLGVLVENHNLLQQAALVAVVGERQRLARELHDSITQSLFSHTLFARAARYALEDNDEEKLQDSLHQLEIGSMAVLKEMRLLLFQMKPLVLEDISLQEAIETRFDDVERRLGIKAICHFHTQTDFPAEVTSELYRVIMEALNNSLKHAAAEEVAVTLQLADETVVLSITDNGLGFDLNQISPGMGLNYMAERISQIEGDLRIETLPGNGTQIIITLPIPPTS